jgi:hypothetical protein
MFKEEKREIEVERIPRKPQAIPQSRPAGKWRGWVLLEIGAQGFPLTADAQGLSNATGQCPKGRENQS